MLNDYNKKSFLDWLYRENQILTQENVVFARDAFFTNSAMRWIIANDKKGNLSREEKNAYVSALRSYIEDELDLCWHEGKICIKLSDRTHKICVGSGYNTNRRGSLNDGKKEIYKETHKEE